ncbi:MAG TPA: Lrp/AsnC family transcriptional regulator [Candidatus Thermoplasmatota archaeon]|nr:Lrp/AsnC family transcriptional regulator [Candidatus Thermoplasmatota archaeon]
MDALDERILSILRGNAREPFVNIAKQLGTSEGTIRARVKKLQKDGVIKRFTVKTAGKGVKALIEVKVETGVHTSDVSQQVAGWKGVEQVWEVSGENDIVVLVNCGATEELNDLVERVRALKEIKATGSRLILKEF